METNNIGHSHLYYEWEKQKTDKHTIFALILAVALVALIAFSK